jgi:glycosyltransferase involved in cell wall biosynthesis
MRIVQAVGWYLPDSLGGTELYVSHLARLLTRRGHEVLVAAPDAAHTNERRYTHDGIAVYRYPVPAEPTRAEARGQARVRGAELFHRWLRETRADLVHAHTFVTGLGLEELEVAATAGARLVVTTHSASLGYLCARGTMLRDGRTLCDGRVAADTCVACVLNQRGLPPPMASAVARLGPALPGWLPRPGRFGTAMDMARVVAERRVAQHRLLARVHGFVVLSDWARQVLIANGAPPSRVFVNRLAIAPRADGWPRKPRPDDVPTPTPVTVGFLGRAEPVKGLDDLVHAVLALPPDVPIRVRAVVVATGSVERAELARLRHAARGDTRIAFEPAVAPREVPATLAAFDVLCCPSRVVEGGPTVALEAQAVGTPVIGTDLPALSEIVEQPTAGVLVPPGDRTALSALLRDIAHDPACVDGWRRHPASPRSFDAVVDDYLALYTA